MWHTVSHVLSAHFNTPFVIKAHRSLPGGELHQTWHLSDGARQVFVKSNTPDFLQDFKMEADQLALLARSKNIRLPEVYGVGASRDNSFLLLEYLPLRPLDAHHAYIFGQQLARLHQWGEQPEFGLDFDNHLATSPQPNCWRRRWSQFFAEQRIGWQLQLAAEKGIFFGDIDKIVTRVEQRLQGHHPTPALLHGDLWPANLGVSQDAVVIFDPACYWGDRECDLAMLPCYPQIPPQLYDGYQSVWSLPSDFTQRQALYQLYHQLNSCRRSHGVAYRDNIAQTISQLHSESAT